MNFKTLTAAFSFLFFINAHTFAVRPVEHIETKSHKFEDQSFENRLLKTMSQKNISGTTEKTIWKLLEILNKPSFFTKFLPNISNALQIKSFRRELEGLFDGLFNSKPYMGFSTIYTIIKLIENLNELRQENIGILPQANAVLQYLDRSLLLIKMGEFLTFAVIFYSGSVFDLITHI